VADQDQRIAALEETITKLADRVRELETESAVTRGSATMKRHLRCTSCGHRKILHSESVLAGSTSGPKGSPVSVTADGGMWAGYEAVGVFEIFVCGSCGRTEWFLPDPAKAAEFMRVIDGDFDDPAGPHR